MSKSILKRAKLCAVAVAAAALIMPVTANVASAAGKFVTIGTAGVTGVYFPAGGAICRLVNTGRKDHGIKCSVESTGGSIYNLNAIRQGEMDLGVAQSDWQYHAYNGTGTFADLGPMEKLRSVFSLHSEPFTVLARADAGISKFSELKGKRVNIGNPGSGMRATMEVVMQLYDWDQDVFSMVSELKASEQGQALCDNKIDAIIYTAGHPNGAIQEVTTTCETKLISVDDAEVLNMVAEKPYYAEAVIPGGMYSGNAEDTKTFGVKATFVSSSDVDPDIIYHTVKAVFDRFDDFKTLHPVFSILKPENMVFEGNTAPLHAGAERYFKESGLYAKAMEKAESKTENAAENVETESEGEVSAKDDDVDAAADHGESAPAAAE